MIGLHVVHNEVVRLTAIQRLANVGKPLVAEVLVNGIHHGDLLVEDHIRIVGNAVGHGVQALEQVNLMVVDANIEDAVGDVHGTHSSLEC